MPLERIGAPVTFLPTCHRSAADAGRQGFVQRQLLAHLFVALSVKSQGMRSDSELLAPGNAQLESHIAAVGRKKSGRAALGWKGIIQKHSHSTAATDCTQLTIRRPSRHGLRAVPLNPGKQPCPVVVQQTVADVSQIGANYSSAASSSVWSSAESTLPKRKAAARFPAKGLLLLEKGDDSDAWKCMEMQAAEALVAISCLSRSA